MAQDAPERRFLSLIFIFLVSCITGVFSKIKSIWKLLSLFVQFSLIFNDLDSDPL